MCIVILSSKQYVCVNECVFVFFPCLEFLASENWWSVIPAKIINIAAKTALSFDPVSSIFCNKCCLLSCGLFFCHLLCVLANSINTTGYQKYASDNVGPPSKRKKEMHQAEYEKCKVYHDSSCFLEMKDSFRR